MLYLTYLIFLTVRLESGKGHYVFDEGIMKNTIYYGGGENLNEARPLPWNKQTIDARQGYVDTFNEYTKENIARSKVLKPLPRPASDIYLSGSRQRMRSEIFDNLRWLSIDFDIPTAGIHTVKVVMIDPEIVVEKLVINPDNEHPSYHGKE